MRSPNRLLLTNRKPPTAILCQRVLSGRETVAVVMTGTRKHQLPPGTSLWTTLTVPFGSTESARCCGARTVRGVLACSALRRCYRDRLRLMAGQFRLIYLYGTPELAERLGARAAGFMAPRLLGSQLATLEPPEAEERPIALNIQSAPDVLVEGAIARLLSL